MDKFLILLVILLTFPTFAPSNALAQIPTIVRPTPKDTACNYDDPKEFHPLRPYPGNPCDKRLPEKELTFACGQAFSPIGKVDLPSQCGAATCNVTRNVNFSVSLDLKDAKVPFLGNTENRSLTDIEKVNEYLGWYLNGTVQQSEQLPIDPKDQKSLERMVNFSGPIKKLLPLDLQEDVRRTLISDLSGPRLKYHNYIVGCKEQFDVFKVVQDYFQTLVAEFNILPELPRLLNMVPRVADLINEPQKALLLIVTNLQVIQSPETDPQKIKAIYDQAGLFEFSDDFSHFASVNKIYITRLSTLINDFLLEHATACTQNGDPIRIKNYYSFTGTALINHLPPNPKDSSNFQKYWDEYVKWLGAADLGILGIWDLPWRPNYWAELFQNIPFSSLEDVVGEISIGLNQAGNPQGANDPKNISLTITNPSLFSQTESRIYIPHLRNIDTMSQLLTSTFRSANLPTPIPNLQTSNKELIHQDLSFRSLEIVPNQPAPSPLIPDPQVSQLCNLSDIRINDGDSVLGKNITANLTYTQTFTYPSRVGAPSGTVCDPGNPTFCASGQCNLNATAGKYLCSAPGPTYRDSSTQISVFSKIPLLGKVYDNLVFGPQSLLRRMLPKPPGKCEGPNQCTTATTQEACTPQLNCTWKADDGTTIKKPDQAVPAYSATNTSVTSSNTLNATVGKPAQIYFPLLGSLADHILGIQSSEQYNLQKALRPLGFSSAASSTNNNAELSGPIDTSPQNECKYTTAQLNGAASLASKKYDVPASMLIAISKIEGGGQYAPDKEYVCQPNFASAVGPMQITSLSYNDNNLTTPDQRTNVTSCGQISGKLNRCNIYDSMELASKLLLQKLAFRPEGLKSCDLNSVYWSACAYYGFDKPECWDGLTDAWKNRPEIKNPPTSGPMSYGHIVCNLMNQANPSLKYCPNYPPIATNDFSTRPAPSACLP